MNVVKQIFSKDFLINQSPASDLQSLLPWIAIFGGLIVLSIASMIIFRKINPVASKIKGMITTWMLSLGLMGLFAIFFRSQQLSIFSKNIFLAIIFGSWFIWLTYIIFWVIFKYPNQLYQYLENQRINRYIPQAKKR